jgi:hypothetical protein
MPVCLGYRRKTEKFIVDSPVASFAHKTDGRQRSESTQMLCNTDIFIGTRLVDYWYKTGISCLVIWKELAFLYISIE